MSSNAYYKHPVNDLANMLKILGEPNRLKILFSMGLECTPVSAIIAATGLTQTNVSFHLRVLREAGLVKGERHGAFIYYCLYDTQLLTLLTDLDEWWQQLTPSREEETQVAPTTSTSSL